MKNYYKILGVDRNASQQEIKNAFRNLSKKHHPDVNDGSKASETIFIEVQEAYNMLKDTSSRQTYDSQMKEARYSQADSGGSFTQQKEQTKVKKQEFNMSDLEENFEHFFGFNPKTKEMSTTKKNSEKKNPIDTTDLFEKFFKR
ncbi:DnaJ domain-containing protein [Sporosarcina limicola]|uniref:Molecular chaperone DnaJ n=1 Tax=Sporosarcina limicola TaxID=34101 RepID=A0A927MJW4_9BACL|nr:DnaJ domain-containing protein [Sporosarcina limicola]MBE1555953.1 molecular chaperone DnaJ [Sporosarcina limicola]